MQKKRYRLFSLFLGFIVLMFSVTVQAQEEPGSLYAQSAVLMDASSGRILYEKNGNEFLANASTTKILTCIIALENGHLEDLVSVSAYAATMPDVQLHIQEGEFYRLEDLLYSLMLESHNDSAVAIAEHIAGSVEEFSRMMNEKARTIGCKYSWFITPNGLDASQNLTLSNGSTEVREHGSTAAELALIMRYCIEQSPAKDTFLTITRTLEHQFTNQVYDEQEEVKNGERNFHCQNHNSFLQMMEGALSGKTGFTNKAGYCYVGSLRRGERTYIAVLLACGWPNNRTYKWQDMKKLINYGLDTYTLHSVEEVSLDWEEILITSVENGQGKNLGEPLWVKLEKKGELIPDVLLREDEVLTAKVEKYPLSAPAEKGKKAGEIIYYIDGKKWKTEGLILKEDVPMIDVVWCLKQCLQQYWI